MKIGKTYRPKTVYSTTPLLLLFCLGIWLVGCNDTDVPGPASGNQIGALPTDTSALSNEPVDKSILFVGGSLTFFNNMPSMVEEIAKEHQIKLVADCLCSPNYWFNDHWAEPDLARLFESQKYDLAILQSGSAWTEENVQVLFQYGHRITELAAENDLNTAFLQPWASLNTYEVFDDVLKNYAGIASATDSELFEVGKIWKIYLEETNDESLYLADGIHPSPKGSFFTAWVVFHTLYPGKSLEYSRSYGKYIDQTSLDHISNIIERYR